MVVLKSKVFTAALWADCWDKVRREVDGCDQGTVIFDEDNGIELDIPFGEILKDRRVLILGGDDLPEELDWLYGFSQDGYWIAVKDVTSSGTSRSVPGGVHQTLSATRLLYSKDEFDPTKKVTGAVLEIGGLAEWLGSSPVIMENYFDGGFKGLVAVRCPLEMVGIDHLRMRHLLHLHHALLRTIHPLNVGLGEDEGIGRFCLGSDVADKVGRTETTVQMKSSEHGY